MRCAGGNTEGERERREEKIEGEKMHRKSYHTPKGCENVVCCTEGGNRREREEEK